jgi:PAS domain S-box-containing protein
MKSAGPIDAAVLEHAALAAALDPIITIDASGIILSASRSVRRVLGWEPEELLGRNVNVLLPEPHRSAHDGYLANYRRTGRTHILNRPRRFEALRKDGSLTLIELCVSRADIAGRDSPLFVGILREVGAAAPTEHAREEDRLRTQQHLTEQTAALRQAYERLRVADQMACIGTLAAGLGHDMNNVLLPVRARLSALRAARQRDRDAAHDLEQLAEIQRCVDYLQQLADGLHLLAMNPEADAAAETATTDLREWWSQTGVLLEKAVEKGIRLSARFDSRLPPVRIAAHGLTQAVLNLIVNASEAIRSMRRARGGRIDIAARRGGRREPNVVRLTVADNGPGMSPEVRRRAFEMFFTTKPRGMGTGLGLALVNRVVTQAGGRIEIDTEEGRGTAIALVLPAAGRGGARKRAGEAPQVHLDVSDGRVRSVVQQMLEAAGATIVSAGEATAADVWVVDAGRVAPTAVRSWRRRRPGGVLVLAGPPAARSANVWRALQPLIIEDMRDLAAIRSTIGRALHFEAGGTDT